MAILECIICQSYGKVNKIKLLENLGSVDFNKLQRKLTLQVKLRGGYMKTWRLMKMTKIEGEDYIMLPKKYVLQMLGLFDKITYIQPHSYPLVQDSSFKEDFALFDEQIDICDNVMENIFTQENVERNFASCILTAEPGIGKTFIILGLIQALGEKTLIITPNTGIMNQWYNVLCEWFAKLSIGKYYGKQKDAFCDNDIIVAVINSIGLCPILGHGFLVLDESHLYATKERSQFLWRIQSKYNIGITATPKDRIDKMDEIVNSHFCNTINAEEIITSSEMNWKICVKATRFVGDNRFTATIVSEKTGMVQFCSIIANLIADPYRNRLIINEVIKYFADAKRYIYVMTDRREHIELLYSELQNREITTYAPELKKLMGGSTQEDIQDAMGEARVIITTYAFSGVGLSIKKMNTLILATPRRHNMKQIVGRICRRGSDPSTERVIVDIWDIRTALSSQFYERNKEYKRRNANVERRDIQFGDLEPLSVRDC